MRITLSGVMSIGDMAESVRAILADLEPGRSYDVLSDHRALAEPATRDQMLQLTDLLATAGHPFHGRRWAVIVGGPASYGMIRMLSVHLEHLPIWVTPFNDPEEARAWIEDGRDRVRPGPT